MAEWYYSRTDDERVGPVSEEEIRELRASGVLKPRTMLWREGMTQWSELRRTPTFNPSAKKASAQRLSSGSPVPDGLRGWMLLAAIIAILSGIPALCFFGFGIFPILAGLHLLAARRLLDDVHVVDSGCELFLKKLRGYFFMLGIFTLAMVGLFIILSTFNTGFGSFGPFGR